MTPQPQPAAYWIELLEELTGGIPFEIKKLKYKKKFVSLKEYLDFQVWMNYQLDSEFKYKLIDCAKYFTSGQNVIDAAVRLREVGQSTPVIGYTEEQQLDYANAVIDNDNQIYIYLRCNGIKR